MLYLNYKETKQRGTLQFPIEYYYVSHQHPQYFMPYHWHEELELVHIIAGTFSVTLDNIHITAQKNDILIINTGVLHSGTPTDCIYECIVFNTHLLCSHPSSFDFLKKLDAGSIILKDFFPANNDKLHSAFMCLFSSMKYEKQGYQLVTLGTLYEILGTLEMNEWYTKKSFQSLTTHRHINQLKKVLAFIEDNYSEKITLDQLSDLVGFSPKYFCRFFYEMTNHTPIDYLNSYRIEVACTYLLNKGLSITEIAYKCGFNDLSYFVKTFKKHKNISPKQYMKQYNQFV